MNNHFSCEMTTDEFLVQLSPWYIQGFFLLSPFSRRRRRRLLFVGVGPIIHQHAAKISPSHNASPALLINRQAMRLIGSGAAFYAAPPAGGEKPLEAKKKEEGKSNIGVYSAHTGPNGNGAPEPTSELRELIACNNSGD